MPHAELDDRPLIERHRRDTLRPTVHEHERGVADHPPPLLRAGHGAADHEPVHAAGQCAGRRELLVGTLIGVGEQHRQPGDPATLLHRAHDLSEEGVGDVGYQHADAAHTSTGQLPRCPVRDIPETRYCRLHRSASGGADQLGAAQYARDRTRVHTGRLGYVGECDGVTGHRTPAPPRDEGGRAGGVSLR